VNFRDEYLKALAETPEAKEFQRKHDAEIMRVLIEYCEFEAELSRNSPPLPTGQKVTRRIGLPSKLLK
jgi:hypothetical protein